MTAGLWPLWAALLFGGFALGQANADRTRRMPAWTRLGSSLALVIAEWGAAAAAVGDPRDLLLWVAVGMTLGFVGDLCMAQWLPFLKPPAHVLGGMLTFGLGHIAYITGLLRFAEQAALTDGALRWGALVGWLIVAVLAWYGVVYRGQTRTPLHLAALPYALLLASTAGVATGLALLDGRFALVAVGAGLFLLSDLILAARLFNGLAFRWVDDLVWLTYGPGQMLIVFGAAAAVG